MKVFVFQGGLGNQIFEYAYYQHELKKNPHLKYLFPKVKCHNGFELDKWFDVKLSKASKWQEWLYWLIVRLKGKGIAGLANKMIVDKDAFFSKDKYFAEGYLQSKKYLASDFIKFRNIELSAENQRFLDLIENTQSIAIHIRRGDYLQPPYDAIYGGICTDEYYAQAIDIIKRNFDNPTFFVFSNDMDWVKNNLKLGNAYYIDCNTGANSPLDMYLMSKTKGLILANSTFSFWGAHLNPSAKLVIYPKKWINKFAVPDIFNKEWLGL